MRRSVIFGSVMMFVTLSLRAQDAVPESDAAKTAAAKAVYAAGREQGLDASGFEILSKSNGTGLGFYPMEVLAAVRKKWYPLIGQAERESDQKLRTVQVEFSIRNDGSLGDIHMVGSSGRDALDSAALNAIKAAAPFAMIPASYPWKSLRLRYHFTYNEKPSPDRPSCGQSRIALSHEASGGRQVLRVGPGIKPPHGIYSPDPEYSDLGRRNKYQGAVMIGGTVEPDGTFSDLCIEQALGSGLDEQALAAVKTWKFKPAIKDERPVPVRIAVEVTFQLY